MSCSAGAGMCSCMRCVMSGKLTEIAALRLISPAEQRIKNLQQQMQLTPGEVIELELLLTRKWSR